MTKPAVAVGTDVGATLAKIVVRDADGSVSQHLEASEALDTIADRVLGAHAVSVGLTGGGAPQLRERLGIGTMVGEFSAWGAGSRALLERAGLEMGDRHLLVSLGTGTSVMLADGADVTRLGGTALGGGTILGLASALISVHSFPEVAALAREGSRKSVDLLVSDIYREGDFELAGEMTASSFGKLGRASSERVPAPSREDVAAALMGLVGENVAIVCGGLAALAQAPGIVFAGSTLRGNPSLADVLRTVSSTYGCNPVFPPDGEFAGAYGALLLAGG